jgi:tRNA pseudouridine38-40 synthase
MAIKNFKCTVSYKGTSFHGWQKQNNILTVQGLIEYALLRFFGGDIKISGASRTDAGVHAFGQVFNFKVETKTEPFGLKKALNGLLPPEIRIVKCVEAAEDFSSRHDAREKLYRYMIYNRPSMPPIYCDLAWHVYEKIDVAKVRSLFHLFKGKKNYFTFSASSDSDKFDREIRSIKIKRNGPWVMIDFKGRSFLYNMVRRMTAAFVEHAKGNISTEQIEKMFEIKDRANLTFTAPAQGLYLVRIKYKQPGEVNKKAEIK